LALASVVAGSALSGVDFSSSASQSAPVRSSFRVTPDMVLSSPAMTYYIVGSEEQRVSILEQATWQVEDNAVYNPDKRWQFGVLMAGTVEAETDALATLDEIKARWTATGASGLEIADVREPELRHSLALQRVPIFVYLVESQTRANNIIAAVESDRNESETHQPMFFAFKATTPEEEASVAAFVETWEGRDIQFLDYRNIAPIE